MINSIFKKLFTADKWNIGFVNQSAESLMMNKGLRREIRWMKEDNIEYAADPFVKEVNGTFYVFYEELDFWNGKGELKVLENFDFRTKKKVSGLQHQHIHTSYPYLLKDEDDLYCIPETSASGEIELYHLDKSDPGSFKKVRTLLRGEQYVDSSVIYHNNKYWLFTSISQKSNELYVYYADSLEQEFTPHSLNPISVCSNASRGAGELFIVNGELYRPTQNPVNRYGGSIVISKIEALSEHNYQHKFEFEIFPEAPYDKGLHNISFSGNMIVFDGKRRVSSAIMPVKKLVKKIRSRR